MRKTLRDTTRPHSNPHKLPSQWPHAPPIPLPRRPLLCTNPLPYFYHVRRTRTRTQPSRSALTSRRPRSPPRPSAVARPVPKPGAGKLSQEDMVHCNLIDGGLIASYLAVCLDAVVAAGFAVLVWILVLNGIFLWWFLFRHGVLVPPGVGEGVSARWTGEESEDHSDLAGEDEEEDDTDFSDEDDGHEEEDDKEEDKGNVEGKDEDEEEDEEEDEKEWLWRWYTWRRRSTCHESV